MCWAKGLLAADETGWLEGGLAQAMEGMVLEVEEPPSLVVTERESEWRMLSTSPGQWVQPQQGEGPLLRRLRRN